MKTDNRVQMDPRASVFLHPQEQLYFFPYTLLDLQTHGHYQRHL